MMLGLGLALSVGACSSSHDSSFLHPYGEVAFSQRRLFFEIIGWMMIVILPVFVAVPVLAWRYRRTSSRSRYSPDWEFSWPLEILVWGVPVAVVGILTYYIWTLENRLDPYRPIDAEGAPLEVQVVGLDWKWLFIYPEEKIATVGTLALPANRPVHFDITSDTVMQSFFIPALGSQIYAMAGMVTQLNLVADRPGTVRGQNTQFNGLGFQEQKFVVEAMAPQDFDAWVDTVRTTGVPLDGAAWQTLQRKSTPKEARAALGTQEMPPTALYFASVSDAFFNDIVDKYRTPPASASNAAQQQTAEREP